jgi:hypothetical protein
LAAAHAVAYDGDGTILLELVDGGLGILEHRIPVGVGDELARIGDLVGRIATLEILLCAIEQRRRDRGVAFAREPVAHRANVIVHAEDFLDHHHAALGRAGGVGPIGAQLVAVIRSQCEMLTQLNLLFSGF